MPLPYEETSGANPDAIYGTGSVRPSAWGLSWSVFWGNSWGFTRVTPPFSGTSGSNPDDFFGSGSGDGPSLYSVTSGSNPDDIYEEN
jgi:hypothetical protein